MAGLRISKFLKDLPIHIPLWMREVPSYPKYWKGDPQLRLCMPYFWMRILKPKVKTPPSVVNFEVHPQMTDYDVKNYLEKIYKVPVARVRTHLEPGKGYNQPEKDSPTNIPRQEADRRIALVQLAEGGTFTFPEFVPEGKSTQFDDTITQLKDMKKAQTKRLRKEWTHEDLPPWFR